MEHHNYTQGLEYMGLNTNGITEVIEQSSHSGFGYGEGSISRTKQLDTGELTSDDERNGLDYILNSDEAFVTVEKKDDGCGDGRIAIYAEQTQLDGTVEHVDTLKHRAKIFGGGVMMVVAGKIANSVILPTSIDQFHNSINFLCAKNAKFGGHDDDRALGDNCGCGAIDRYPEIIKNIQHFNTEIKSTIIELFGDDFKDVIFDEVTENFRKVYGVITEEKEPYKGKDVKNLITEKGAVVKRLSGGHQEDFVVINFIQGTTLNQAGLMGATNNRVQAFCVDAWRLIDYSNLIADGDQDSFDRALYGMLMYTLATSATLTDGSQRVLVRK